MSRCLRWLPVLASLARCGCHWADRCPSWPDSYVGRFRGRKLP